MTSVPHQRPDRMDPRFGPSVADQRHPLLAIGLAVIVSLVLVGVSVVAGTFVVHTVGAAFPNNANLRGAPAEHTSDQQILTLQSALVEQRRAAVTTYAASLAGFKVATDRPAGASGINLDAAEARRRDGVLNALVLDCIDAVDAYNLAALARSATQLQSAALPERFVWETDCASGQ